MLLSLIRLEFLAHLMSARFFAALVITLLLVIANTFVLIGAHEERVADYSQRKMVNREKVAAIPTYSFLKITVERPPNVLSLFSAGLETRYGSNIDIEFDVVPSLSSPGPPLGVKNPYLLLFSQIDLVFIFQVVLSLLALLFAYDAIAGDSETGILRLVISHPVSRGHIVFAKYIAAMVCLLLPVLMNLLLVLIQCSFALSLQLRTDDFLRIGGIFLSTIFYLSVFYLIGLFISTTTRRSATSLMFCLFLWVVLVLVYPNWVLFSLNPVGEMRAEERATEQQIDQISEEASSEIRRFLANSPLKGRPPAFTDLFRHSSVARYNDYFYRIKGELRNEAEPLVPHLRGFYEFAARLGIRTAEKIGLVRQQLLTETLQKQAQWDERLLKLSPAGLYTLATSAWAGTDLDTMVDYIRAAQTYRLTLIDYVENKDAFASLQWFTTNQRDIDWASLPAFRFDRADVGQNTQRALPEMLLLFLINFILLMVTVLIFLKKEI